MSDDELFDYRDEFDGHGECLDDELGKNFEWDNEYDDWFNYKNKFGEEGLFESEVEGMEQSWDRQIESVEESLEELVEKATEEPVERLVEEEEPAKEFDMTTQISRVEAQRTMNVSLLRRKKMNMKMLTKLYRIGLVSDLFYLICNQDMRKKNNSNNINKK